jgi:TRAP-type C4-dicarboxylate transport system permease small subunit
MTKKGLMDVSDRLSTWFEIVAGVALMGIMVLTGCDIVGRVFGHPIPGTFEIVSFAGGIVIGLAMPVTSRVRGHVIVDLIIAHVSKGASNVLHIITRLMVIVLFLLLIYAMTKMGMNLHDSGEVTPVLSLPFYLIAYAFAGACFVECLILIGDIVKGGGDPNE